MDIDANKVYNFIFHPLSDEHSKPVQALALLTDIALAILTAGFFLIAFSFVQLKDRDIKVNKGSTPTSHLATSIIKHSPSNPKLSQGSAVPSSQTTSTPKSALVKADQAKQLETFEKWAKEGKWKNFHEAHYDWWMFPISRPSRGHGDRYAVSNTDVTTLKNDPEFMKNYLRGVELVAESWGWDVKNNKPFENPSPHQKWANLEIRLTKIIQSLDLFDEMNYSISMRNYKINYKP